MILLRIDTAHGTYIGSIWIEGRKPQQVPIDSEIHFGASTRRYTIRERPQNMTQILGSSSADNKSGEDLEGSLLGLPETETELDVGHLSHLLWPRMLLRVNKFVGWLCVVRFLFPKLCRVY